MYRHLSSLPADYGKSARPSTFESMTRDPTHRRTVPVFHNDPSASMLDLITERAEDQRQRDRVAMHDAYLEDRAVEDSRGIE